MTRGPRTPSQPEPIDDAAIEQLVRDVAGGWEMPPVRLDAPAWRDRVRSPGARRVEAARGWLGRAGRAGSAAVALTVVAAIGAVLITRPPGDAGKSPAPSAAGTPRPTAGFTPLPRLMLDGDLPSPTTVLLRVEDDFALADLETGKLGANLTGAVFGSALRRQPDGSAVCLCVRTSNRINGQPTEAEVTLDRFDAGGALRSSVSVRAISGEPDPRDGALQERPVHLAFEVSFSADGRYGFVGWSERAHPVWRSGIVVVDVTTGAETSRIDLPDATTGEGDTRRVVFAPRIAGPGGGDTLVIAREWYSWSPPESAGLNYRQETDVFRSGFAAGLLADGVSIDASSCGQRVLRAGALADGRWWIACVRGSSNQVAVRRFDVAGTRLGESTAPGAGDVGGDMTALSPDGRSLYAWNPLTASITRLDLATGDTTVGRAVAAAAEPGPLAALGDWLAPGAFAKTFLESAVVVSPDGRRVYAAGVDPAALASEMAGSTGIFVFDAESLAPIGQWEPTADFVSIATSADGRFVYAAGLPGFDAAGTRRPAQAASITVFDASDGSVRLIAGQLGGRMLAFTSPVLE